MSTVGHFISMIGVFCFYTTLLESSFERKLTPVTINLVPRFYVDSTFIYLKTINIKLNKKKKINFLKKKKILKNFKKILKILKNFKKF